MLEGLNGKPKRGRRSNKERTRLRLADRRAKVLQATIAGNDCRAIAAEFDVSHTTILKDIKAAIAQLENTTLTGAAELRRVQHARITQAIEAVWINVKLGDLDSIATMIRLMDREAKLLGLDAPTRIDVRRRIEERADELGFDKEGAIAEWERLIRENAAKS